MRRLKGLHRVPHRNLRIEIPLEVPHEDLARLRGMDFSDREVELFARVDQLERDLRECSRKQAGSTPTIRRREPRSEGTY